MDGRRDRPAALRRLLAVAAAAIALLVALGAVSPAGAVDPLPVEEGTKLTAGSEGAFGYSVGLSADGKTAIVGAPRGEGSAGTAWIFVRTATGWSQQAQLTGTEESSDEGGEACVGEPGEEPGACRFGTTVAMSADGNTAMVGAWGDGGHAGAAWAFTRSGSTWTQQGPKITGGGEIAMNASGAASRLSGDGNTAIVGAPGAGVAWVLLRSGGYLEPAAPGAHGPRRERRRHLRAQRRAVGGGRRGARRRPGRRHPPRRSVGVQQG